MEPARDERGDDQKDAAEITQINAPQWSPLAMSGATQGPGRGQAPALRAAMEPARDERGDRAATSSARWNASAPQWSPLAMSGATRSSAPDGPA